MKSSQSAQAAKDSGNVQTAIAGFNEITRDGLHHASTTLAEGIIMTQQLIASMPPVRKIVGMLGQMQTALRALDWVDSAA